MDSHSNQNVKPTEDQNGGLVARARDKTFLVHVVVFLSVGSVCELYCCPWDMVTCACHEGTGLHVHVMKGQGYMCMS